MPYNYLIFLYKQYSQFFKKSSSLDILGTWCATLKYMLHGTKYVWMFLEILLRRMKKTVTL